MCHQALLRRLFDLTPESKEVRTPIKGPQNSARMLLVTQR
jgi:hypothetical protein